MANNNSNLILENGQFLMEKIPASSSSSSRNMQMYVGDGITTLANLQPVGVLPDVLQRMIFIHDNTHGLQIPIVIADEDGNIVYPGVPVQGGTGGVGSGAGVGEIRSFLLDAAPAGWLECDGSQLNETDYPDLYVSLDSLSNRSDYIIDANTFYLPDLRDQFLRGKTVGREAGTRQLDALQNITGRLPFSFLTGAISGGTNGALSAGFTTNYWSLTGGAKGYINGITLDASYVARTDVETRPVNIATLFCIKY